MVGGMCGSGGVHGRACMPPRFDEIRSMSGRYASYWNAFLLYVFFICFEVINPNVFVLDIPG